MDIRLTCQKPESPEGSLRQYEWDPSSFLNRHAGCFEIRSSCRIIRFSAIFQLPHKGVFDLAEKRHQQKLAMKFSQQLLKGPVFRFKSPGIQEIWLFRSSHPFFLPPKNRLRLGFAKKRQTNGAPLRWVLPGDMDAEGDGLHQALLGRRIVISREAFFDLTVGRGFWCGFWCLGYPKQFRVWVFRDFGV